MRRKPDNHSQIDHVDSSVQATTVKVYAKMLAITPTAASVTIAVGVSYGIVNVQRDPAGTAWVMQCRA